MSGCQDQGLSSCTSSIYTTYSYRRNLCSAYHSYHHSLFSIPQLPPFSVQHTTVTTILCSAYHSYNHSLPSIPQLYSMILCLANHSFIIPELYSTILCSSYHSYNRSLLSIPQLQPFSLSYHSYNHSPNHTTVTTILCSA